ncbi:MAG TPA: YceI family protein [Streptosporangiaceae bacterium]
MTTTSSLGLAAGRWRVDPGPSTATFRVASLGRTVTGTVPIIEGTVEIDDHGQPGVIAGSLDLGAISTGSTRRDRDLRQPKFLDLDTHPTMTFAAGTSTVTPAGWQITGQLAARGTSVPLSGPAEVAPRGRSAIVTAHTRLDRRALGIRAPRIMIGRVVDITVTATLTLATAP